MKQPVGFVAACAAVLLGATALDALGADSEPAPSGEQTASVEFPGIGWGPFLIFPVVTLAVAYDDNIYAEPANETGDTMLSLSPTLAAKSRWQRHALKFDVGADLNRYSENDAENVDDYWLGFDGRYDLTAHANVFGGARHSRNHEDRSQAGALSPAAQREPTLYERQEAHLGVAHNSGAIRLRLGGTVDRYDYRDGASSLGTPVDNDYRDHDLSALGIRLGYALSPGSEIFCQYATDVRDYAGPIDGLTFNRDSSGYRAAAGVRFNLGTVRAEGEAFAGVMRQDFEYGGFAEVSDPYFGGLVRWRPTPRLTAIGFVERSLQETIVFDAASYASSSLDTTYGLELEQRLSAGLSVNGRAYYTHSAFQNFSRVDRSYNVGAGLRFYVVPAIYLGADLNAIERNSTDPLGTFKRHQAVLTIGYTPGRNAGYATTPSD